jgi:hypothetical protein
MPEATTHAYDIAVLAAFVYWVDGGDCLSVHYFPALSFRFFSLTGADTEYTWMSFRVLFARCSASGAESGFSARSSEWIAGAGPGLWMHGAELAMVVSLA